jgi:hypothetical protein
MDFGSLEQRVKQSLFDIQTIFNGEPPKGSKSEELKNAITTCYLIWKTSPFEYAEVLNELMNEFDAAIGLVKLSGDVMEE